MVSIGIKGGITTKWLNKLGFEKTRDFWGCLFNIAGCSNSVSHEFYFTSVRYSRKKWNWPTLGLYSPQLIYDLAVSEWNLTQTLILTLSWLFLHNLCFYSNIYCLQVFKQPKTLKRSRYISIWKVYKGQVLF